MAFRSFEGLFEGLPRDFAAATRFFTRLPVPSRFPHAAPDMEAMAPLLTLVGTLVGLIGLIVHLTGLTLHFGPFVSATLASVAMIVATGALHEDGLADCADGLGGSTAAARLDIMRDSRLGAFGVLAIGTFLLLRIGAISELSRAGLWMAGLAIVASQAASRFGAVWVLHALPAARVEGASAAAGRVSERAMQLSAASSILITMMLIIPSYGILAALTALALMFLMIQGVTTASRQLVGGQTGDVAGAAVALGEIAFLLALLIFAAPL